MRVLVLSDTHANFEALNAVLKAAPPYDQVWNLGDIVGYGANPNEVISIASKLGSVFVRGNHDKACSGVEDLGSFNPIAARAASWTRSVLTSANLQWLRELPAGPVETADPKAICAHGSPLGEDQYLATERDAYLPLARASTRINFFGHTHVQGAFATNREDMFRLLPRYSETASKNTNSLCAKARDTSSIPAPWASPATAIAAPPSPSTKPATPPPKESRSIVSRMT